MVKMLTVPTLTLDSIKPITAKMSTGLLEGLEPPCQAMNIINGKEYVF